MHSMGRDLRRTVERLVHRGVLHLIRLGRSWRFDRDQAFEDLDAMK